MNCGGDFAFHKELYEKHFEEYDAKLIVEKGNLRILDYKTYIDEDIYYFDKKENFKKIKIFIEINKETKEGKIYIIKEEKEHIYTFKCEKIEKKESIWLKIKDNWIKMLI
ncbi:MAG: hypothetical protein IJY25_02290 [Bacilli bacterium]|nr:hypothetical protein [Bacilli bacterium]